MSIPSIRPVTSTLLLVAILACPITSLFADFDAETGWNGHLFPSYIIATATMKDPDATSEMEDSDAGEDADATDSETETPNGDDDDSDDVDMSDSEYEILGDERGLLGITIEATEDAQEVTVTISCDEIMEPSSITCTLSKSGETYTVNPKIKYKYEQLARRTQTGPITVTYSVEVGENDAEEKFETLTLRSINDCPYGRSIDGTWTSTRFMFAAYVNEQHPFVDGVLREALNSKIVNSFTGHQSKDKVEVYRQAYAIWYALSQRDVRYSNVTQTVAASDTVGSQHIRLIDESIDNGQANCVDGSVLLASLLRKIDIEPILVHVPGHCYLAFVLDEEGKELTGIETTMIGSEIEGNAINVKGLENVIDQERQADNSWKTFCAAIARGTANLKKFEKEFSDPENQRYKLISVAGARKSGILPIGFQSKRAFVAAPKKTDDEE